MFYKANNPNNMYDVDVRDVHDVLCVLTNFISPAM